MTDLRPVCEDHDPRVFYPHRGDRAANRYAVALCLTCPLRAKCLDGALDRREEWGVWGGSTEKDRAKLRKVAAEHGGNVSSWQHAIRAHEQRPTGIPERAPAPRAVVPTSRRLAVVTPEPTMPQPRIHVPCRTPKCGDLLTGGGAPRGWVLVRIIGSGAPRRYCDPVCAVLALTAPKPVVAVPTPARVVPMTKSGKPRQRATSALRVSNDQLWRDSLVALGRTPADVRVWCAANGWDVPARGPLNVNVRTAYLNAHATTGATA